MNFQFVSLFPELIESGMQTGVIGQAVSKNILSFGVINLREFATDKHKTVDDRPYGGGDGMVMQAEPLKLAIAQARERQENTRVVFMSPQGQPLTQAKAKQLCDYKSITFVCGRYSGIDQRLINTEIDEEISLGDFVISGGELAGLVVADAVARNIDGVLGHPQSASLDSFAGGGGLLEAGVFTRPQEYASQKVPAILMSGDHALIAQARQAVSVIMTLQKRPDISIAAEEVRVAIQWLFSQDESELAAWGVSPETVKRLQNQTHENK